MYKVTKDIVLLALEIQVHMVKSFRKETLMTVVNDRNNQRRCPESFAIS